MRPFAFLLLLNLALVTFLGFSSEIKRAPFIEMRSYKHEVPLLIYVTSQ